MVFLHSNLDSELLSNLSVAFVVTSCSRSKEMKLFDTNTRLARMNVREQIRFPYVVQWIQVGRSMKLSELRREDRINAVESKPTPHVMGPASQTIYILPPGKCSVCCSQLASSTH